MSSGTASPSKIASSRFGILDAIRGFAACFVFIAHFGNPPLLTWVQRDMGFWYPIKALYGNAIPGPPAVIVFFVISGFCIHYPNRGKAKLPMGAFFARRFTRIGVPMLVAVGLSIPMEVNLSVFRSSVLWSLVAELIYYALYPLLRAAAFRTGWLPLLGISFLGSAIALSRFPNAIDYTPFGNSWNWLLCLPAWVIGCILADGISFQRPADRRSSRKLIAWRLGVWGWAVVASALRFHSPVGYPWTLFFFGIPIYFWLREELAASSSSQVTRVLEWMGQWSYSLYLVHMLGIAIFISLPISQLPGGIRWPIGATFILGLAYLYYRVVELPSHNLSRRFAHRIEGKVA